MSIRPRKHLPISAKLKATKTPDELADCVTLPDVLDLVKRAYNQGFWDGCHSRDPRVSVHTRPHGLKRHLQREAKRLRQ